MAKFLEIYQKLKHPQISVSRGNGLLKLSSAVGSEGIWALVLMTWILADLLAITFATTSASLASLRGVPNAPSRGPSSDEYQTDMAPFPSSVIGCPQTHVDCGKCQCVPSPTCSWCSDENPKPPTNPWVSLATLQYLFARKTLETVVVVFAFQRMCVPSVGIHQWGLCLGHSQMSR